MPGLLGYYDPEGLLPEGIELAMAHVLQLGSACRTVFARANRACVGNVDRGVFPAAGEVLTGTDGNRRACLQGEIVAFSEETEPVDPIAAGRRCLCEGLGGKLLARAVGSFAAAVLDVQSQTLELVTDRNGSIPVYYARLGRGLVFATQQKALLTSGAVSPELDPLAVSEMLQLGFVTAEATLLKGVCVMPPGAILSMAPDGMRLERYWQHEFRCTGRCDWDREVDRLASLLAQAVGRTFRPRARIGVPVSGGLDSRALLALSPHRRQVPSLTFGAQGSRDLRFGRDIARSLGSPHCCRVVDPGYLNEYIDLGVWLTEGLLGATHFHVLPHVVSLARRSDIVLDGIGGDVILGGKYVKHPWLYATDLDGAGQAIWSWLATQVPAGMVGQLTSRLVSPDIHAAVKDRFVRLYERSRGQTPMDKAMAFLLENRTRRFIGGGPTLLRWRVEVLEPFFDNDFVTAVARLPHRWRKRQRLCVAVLKKAVLKAARLRWQHTGLPVAVPYGVSWLAMAFQRGADLAASRVGIRTLFPHREASHFSDWFRGPLQPLLERVLLSPRTLDRGLVSADLTIRVVHEHLRGRIDGTLLLSVLLSLELFCRQFVDDFQSSVEAWSGSRDERGSGGAHETRRPA